jgi:hypothetical protein
MTEIQNVLHVSESAVVLERVQEDDVVRPKPFAEQPDIDTAPNDEDADERQRVLVTSENDRPLSPSNAA